MRFSREINDEEPEINLIPLIDVLLVILIFLTATTTFTRLSALPLTLPSVTTELPTQPEEVIMEITANGLYAVNGEQVSSDPTSLCAALSRAVGTPTPDAGRVLVIYADAQAPHQTVVSAMQAAQEAGLSRVSFGTRVSDQ